jgi:hypothetical protein
VLLHPPLGALDGFVQPLVLQHFAFLDAQLFHDAGDALRTEQTHQIVFQRHVEPGGTGIALAGATAAQLAVNTAGLVALGGDYVQSARFLDQGLAQGLAVHLAVQRGPAR